jgi:hypothetical protein
MCNPVAAMMWRMLEGAVAGEWASRPRATARRPRCISDMGQPCIWTPSFRMRSTAFFVIGIGAGGGQEQEKTKLVPFEF